MIGVANINHQGKMVYTDNVGIEAKRNFLIPEHRIEYPYYLSINGKKKFEKNATKKSLQSASPARVDR